MRFFLGTHETSWLARLDVPLFVSHVRLKRRKSFKRAACDWALDSGAFSEVKGHGRFRMSVAEYVDAVATYRAEIGRLQWAAPMDWMCEPEVVAKTGLSVLEHQHRTVDNYLELRDQGPFIPVLQGWTLADYERCVSLYEDADVDLRAVPVVGVGSVCRRQNTAEIAYIFRHLAGGGLRLHGFGVKTGVGAYGKHLASIDSMAWSFKARKNPPLPGCSHKSCSNCSRYALQWRSDLLASLNGHLAVEESRPRLWEAA